LPGADCGWIVVEIVVVAIVVGIAVYSVVAVVASPARVLLAPGYSEFESGQGKSEK